MSAGQRRGTEPIDGDLALAELKSEDVAHARRSATRHRASLSVSSSVLSRRIELTLLAVPQGYTYGLTISAP